MAGKSDEMATLGALSQAAAAWLIGMSARTLRDQAAPRARDGTYDAQKLVRWAMTRGSAPRLSDDQRELVLLVVDELAGVQDEHRAGVAAGLQAIVDQHGPAGAVEIVRELIELLAGLDQVGGVDERAELQRHEDREVEREAWAKLRVRVRCLSCGKIRHGSEWIKGDLPRGYAEIGGECPSCMVGQHP